MITNSSKVSLTYEELEKLFNDSLDKEISEWKKEKDAFIADSQNSEGKITGKHMPAANFQIWIKIPVVLCPNEILNRLKSNIESAGWSIKECEWQINERTGSEQLYLYIRKFSLNKI